MSDSEDCSSSWRACTICPSRKDNASAQMKLLNGEVAVQTVGRTFLLAQGQAADLPAEGVPRWRTSCSRWLSCQGW